MFESSDLLLMTFPSYDDRNIWMAGVRFAVYGARLREGYEETCRRFEKLAELGEFNPEAAKSFKAPKRKDLKAINKMKVKQWQSIRAASSDRPNVSAATGVEFDDDEDDDGNANGAASTSGDGGGGSDGIPPELVQHKWFHGPISRATAEDLFAQYNHA